MTPTEKRAAEQALQAWKRKADAKAGGRRPGATGRKPQRGARPPGWSWEEAAEIVGVTTDRLDEFGCFDLPSSGHWEGADFWMRFDLVDLFQTCVLVDLAARGVPLLVQVAVRSIQRWDRSCFDDDDDFDADVHLNRIAEDSQPVTYPLTYELAERWVLEGHEETSWLRATPEDAPASVDRGEAVVYDASAAARRVLTEVDRCWVKNS